MYVCKVLFEQFQIHFWAAGFSYVWHEQCCKYTELCDAFECFLYDLCIQYDKDHTSALRIKNTSESIPCSYEEFFNCEDHLKSLVFLISAVHSYDLYHIHIMSFSSYNGYKLNSHLTCFQGGFIAQSVEHHTGIAEVIHGFESRWSLRIFSGLYL